MWIKRVTIFLLVVVCVALLAGAAYYERKGVIIKIDSEYIYIEDSCGYTWKYKGEGAIGDKVTLVLNSRGTTTISDDKIVKVRG